jgi:hypothetical protein
MSRHRFIEELAQELWEEQRVPKGGGPWREVEPRLRQQYLNLAADTLRFLEHGHG